MAFSVTLKPSQHRFQIEADESILDAALRQGIGLPYGCRDGACGACKGKVLDGRVDFGAAQEHALTLADRADGMALFCCARPHSDLELECRVLGSLRDIPIKNLPVRVEKLEFPAADVAIVSLKLPTHERLQFLAGQYVDIVLKDGRRRSFSLANAAHDDAFLQLHIRRVPDGQFTEHVFTRLKVRDILRICGPHGTFHLQEASTGPMILLAGGTGFAPLKAIVEHCLFADVRRDIYLYWGARTRADLYLHDLPLAWAEAQPHIRYIPVLSDLRDDAPWEGRRGLVHRAVMADHPDLSGFQVYACGAPGMIEAARADLVRQCGLPPDEFFADAFTYASDAVPA